MELFIAWLVCSGVVAYIASSRGRLPFDYFLLSALLSPLVGLIILLTKANLTAEARMARLRRDEHDRQIEALRSVQNAGAGAESSRVDSTASAPLVADELEKLARLRDNGVLSSEEFQARKELLLK